jgi:hypothetical protein
VPVHAETRDDAILHAGLAIAMRSTVGDPRRWIVTGVHDPAER